MKAFVLLLVVCTLPLHAQESGKVRLGLLSGIMVARTFDWITTEKCVHSPSCHEIVLPGAIAKSKPALAAFEVSALASEWFVSKRLSRRHPKMAVILDSIDLSMLTATDIRNFTIVDGNYAPAPPTQSTQSIPIPKPNVVRLEVHF